MKITKVCKADSPGKYYTISEGGTVIEKEVESQAIYITDKIPEGMTLEKCQAFHEKQAFLINKMLADTLPQGTYDRLGIMFMQKKVSLYRGRVE